jgi:hypothetical protein
MITKIYIMLVTNSKVSSKRQPASAKDLVHSRILKFKKKSAEKIINISVIRLTPSGRCMAPTSWFISAFLGKFYFFHDTFETRPSCLLKFAISTFSFHLLKIIRITFSLGSDSTGNL